jgi:hypothetical protein
LLDFDLVVYRALACASQEARFFLPLNFLLHAFSALTSFCAFVSGRLILVTGTAGLDEGTGKLPTPLNVTLEGVANTGGADGRP